MAVSSGIGSGLGCPSSHPPIEKVVVELVRNHARHEDENEELEVLELEEPEDVGKVVVEELELEELEDVGKVVHGGVEGIVLAGMCWAAVGGTPREDAHPDSSWSRSGTEAVTSTGSDSNIEVAVLESMLGTSTCVVPSSTTPRTQPKTRPQTAAQNRQRPRRAMIAKRAEALGNKND